MKRRWQLSAPERAEHILPGHVERWREALAAHTEDEGAAFAALLAAAAARSARARGLASGAEPWPGCEASGPLVERARELLEASALGDALWREPHALGWLHQSFHAQRRRDSFAAHTRRERKHATATATTQLFTPRWVADFLAQATLAGLLEAPGPPPRVCDPAAGGGQMLLAALDELARRRPELGAAELAGALVGVELDARAVASARACVALRLAELAGQRVPRAEARVRAQIRQGDGLTQPDGRVEVALTNPPYMGSRSMPAALKRRLRQRWRRFHHDLYLAFMSRCVALATRRAGLLTQQTVWFLSRYEPARRALLERARLTHFAHLGAGLFAALSGEKASVVASVHSLEGASGEGACLFLDLRGGAGPDELEAALEAPPAPQPLSSFEALPGAPLAHWLPRRWRGFFEEGLRLEQLAEVPGSQHKTGANRRFVRAWDEVDPARIRPAEGLWPPPHRELEAREGAPRWVFYSKGGRFGPWWGNWEHVVDWSPEARAFYRDNRTSNRLDRRYRYREGLCYTDFGGRQFNARWMPAGCLFDMAGPAILVKGRRRARRRRLLALMAVLNTTPTRILLNALNPSLHYQVRDVRNLPLPPGFLDWEARLARRARGLVQITRALHLIVPGDPLCDEELASSGEAPSRAAALIEALRRGWAELDALVCRLYGAPHLECGAPAPLHHIVEELPGLEAGASSPSQASS